MSGILIHRPRKITMDEILTPEQAAAKIKVLSLWTIKKKAQLGEIPCHWLLNSDNPRSRRGLFFVESELLDWMGLNRERKTA